MPSNFSLPSYRPRAHNYRHGEQRAHRRWLGALRSEAAICQLKLVCHSNPNSLQPFQSVPPQVGTSGRAAITPHTHSYYSCLPIHLILAKPTIFSFHHYPFDPGLVPLFFYTVLSFHRLSINQHPLVMNFNIIYKTGSLYNMSLWTSEVLQI